MILLIDNYDSFVYNLARYFEVLGHKTHVVRNDAITIDRIKEMNPSQIILSPGPCTPLEAGISISIVKEFYQTLPILGVCLGHQVIGHVFGATITRAQRPLHGQASLIHHHKVPLFHELTSPLQVGRYHSLVVSKEQFPSCLIVTAKSDDGEIMALQHRYYPTIGVQFHPESILTNQGLPLLKNFLNLKINRQKLILTSK